MSSSDQTNDLTSKLHDLSIHNRGIKPGAQAKLLAFQAKRLQQQNQQLPSPVDRSNSQYSLASPVNSSPSTPKSDNNSGQAIPINFKDGDIDNNDDTMMKPADSLIRRTSFRLPKKKLESSENSSGSISANASLNSNKSFAMTPATTSLHSNINRELGKPFGNNNNKTGLNVSTTNSSSCESSEASTPCLLTPSENEYTRIAFLFDSSRSSTESDISSKESQSNNNDNNNNSGYVVADNWSVSSNDTIINNNNNNSHKDNISIPATSISSNSREQLPSMLNSTPNLSKIARLEWSKKSLSSPITPSIIQATQSSTASRAPQKKVLLSHRRGMKIDFGGLNTDNNKTTISSNSALLPNLNDDAMNKLKRNALPQRGLSGISAQATIISSNNNVAGSIMSKKPNFKLPQSQIKPTGMFANYSKYIDIKSGSLNFSGKASVHSKGVDFSNGSSFRISQEDLEFMEELGRGNYGIVSKVLHKPTGIIMAMKEVRLELDDSKFRQILMELEVLHSCVSDCIVDFYGAFFVEGAVYMCMEYMQGGSLDKVYNYGITEPQLAYITKCIVKGLKQLKDDHNIIHRDVKPTNILVNEIGKIKLCDFGVSGNLVASLARTNIGCQSYMAPERIKSSSPDVTTYTVQSDIWSLGLSILEIAKGCYPYPPETFNNIFSQLSAIVDGEPPTLPVGKYSLDAQDFISQCLNKDPNERPIYSKLLNHKWLNKYDDLECQKLMSGLVSKKLDDRKSKHDGFSITLGSSASLKSAVPALHNGRLCSD